MESDKLIITGAGGDHPHLPALQRREGAIVDAAALGRPLGAQVQATLQAATHSEHTQRAYRHAIGLFLQYLGGALGVGELATRTTEGRATIWAYADVLCSVLRAVEPGHLAGFRAWREAEGDSPNTASQRQAIAATFLSVAYRDGILTDTQALQMGVRSYRQRQKRDRKPTGRRLTREEARALRAAPDIAMRKGRRDVAILDCALYAGLRVDEIVNLDADDLQQDRGRWWIILTGKGSQTRKIKLHDELYKTLSAWLQDTGREIGHGHGTLFVGMGKGDRLGAARLGTADVNRLVALYGEQAGVSQEHGKGRLGPHDLRRTCARNAYDNGAPLPLIQALLGHASPDTTMLYIGAGDDDSGGAIEFVHY
jgi:integrase